MRSAHACLPLKHCHAHAHALCNADNPEFRRRVSLALGLMVGAKVLNVCVPVLMKTAVDALAPLASTAGGMAAGGLAHVSAQLVSVRL